MLRRDSMNWTMVPSREIVCDARMPSDDSCPIRRFESAVAAGSRSRRAVRSGEQLEIVEDLLGAAENVREASAQQSHDGELQREHGDGRRCEAGVVPEEQRCDEQQRQQQRDRQYPARSESIRAIRPSARAPRAARRHPQSRRAPPGLRADRGARAAPQRSAVVRAPPERKQAPTASSPARSLPCACARSRAARRDCPGRTDRDPLHRRGGDRRSACRGCPVRSNDLRCERCLLDSERPHAARVRAPFARGSDRSPRPGRVRSARATSSRPTIWPRRRSPRARCGRWRCARKRARAVRSAPGVPANAGRTLRKAPRFRVHGNDG